MLKNKSISFLSSRFFLPVIIFVLFVSYTHTHAQTGCNTPECLYSKANKSYEAMLKNQKLKGKRDNWIKCIREFEKVQKKDPNGSWAPAGLYMSGLLYKQLYQYSKNQSDIENAVEYLKKASEYKKTRYSQEAGKVLKTIPEKYKTDKKNTDSESPSRETSKKGQKDSASPDKTKSSEKTDSVTTPDKTNSELPAKKGQKDLGGKAKTTIDKDTSKSAQKKDASSSVKSTSDSSSKASLDASSKSATDTASSSKENVKKDTTSDKSSASAEKDTAKSAAASKKDLSSTGTTETTVSKEDKKGSADEEPATTESEGKDLKDSVSKLIQKTEKDVSRSSRKEKSGGSNGTKASLIKGIRFGSLPTRTRIVIDTDIQVHYKHDIVKDTDKSSQRIDIEIKNSRMSSSAKHDITIDDDRVKNIHANGKSGDGAVISINIKSFKDYKIFPLRSPSRIVVDVWGQSSASQHDEEQETEEYTPPPKNALNGSASDLARQLHLGVKRVVIDPGHGGHDPGAPGFDKGVDEKTVVLAIGKKLAEKLKNSMGLEVIMTRSDDTFISLEERTRIANKNKADLFISIHTNSSQDKRAYGVETYFLNLAKDKDSVAVAARENATSEKNISDLQSILDSLMRNTKITESSRLATYVQDALYKGLKKEYNPVKNKGVKQAPFYVLLGARMPAILIETSFISNKRECELLSDDEYQDDVCDNIIDGIKKYIHKTSPVTTQKKR